MGNFLCSSKKEQKRREGSQAPPAAAGAAGAGQRHADPESRDAQAPDAKRLRTEAGPRELHCPAARAGWVIGKGGCRIRQLESETGARIRVNKVGPDASVITFEGTDQQVAAARSAVGDIVDPPTEVVPCPRQFFRDARDACRDAERASGARLQVACGPDTVTITGPRAALAPAAAAVRALSGSTATVECPGGRLPRGAVLQECQRSTGARVSLDRDAAVVTICGSPAQVQAARTALLAALNPPTATVMCPADKVHEVIGKGGCVVRKIQDESGARVSIDQKVRGQGPASVVISGTVEQVQRAREAVLAIVSPPCAYVDCPPDAIGALMGDGGENFREIEERCGEGDFANSGVYVQISLEGGRVKIEASTPVALERCKQLVAAEVASAVRSGDYEGDRGRSLRREASALYERARAAGADEVAARKRGDHAQAAALRAHRQELLEAARGADERAAAAIFDHRNSALPPLEIDLHGLRVDEAVRFLRQRLDHFLANDVDDRLECITGAGHHSENGLARIRQRVLALVKEQGLQCEVKNAGSLIIHC